MTGRHLAQQTHQERQAKRQSRELSTYKRNPFYLLHGVCDPIMVVGDSLTYLVGVVSDLWCKDPLAQYGHPDQFVLEA